MTRPVVETRLLCSPGPVKNYGHETGRKPGIEAKALGRVGGCGVGIVAAAIGILPWLLAGAHLPIQNLWVASNAIDSMPVALLPVSQYQAWHIFALLVFGGVLAAVVLRLFRLSLPVGSASLGLLGAHAIIVIQAYIVVARGLGLGTVNADPRAGTYFGVLLAGTLASVGVAQLLFWLCMGSSRGAVTLGFGLAAVPVGAFVVTIFAVGASAGRTIPTWATWSERWLPAIIAGAALGWCGVKPAKRLGVWVGVLAALFFLPACFVAVDNALGSRALLHDLPSAASNGFHSAVSGLGSQGAPVLLALAIGLVFALVAQNRGKR